MNQTSLTLLSLTILLLVGGCAKFKVTRLPGDDDYTEGIRFYRPTPYLLVTLDNEGKPKGSIVMLPDRSQEYVIRQRSGLGVSNLQFTLADGWNLTGFTHNADSKIPETIGALTQLVPSLVTKTKDEKPVETGLYEFVYRNDRVAALRRVPLE